MKANKTYTKADVGPSILCNIADFSVDLFKHIYVPTKNTLVSPASLLAVLTMIQQGAKGTTRAELDTVIGRHTEEVIGLLNTMLSDKADEGDSFESLIYDADQVVRSANAIWLKDDETVNFDPAYIDQCRKSCGAEVFLAPFSDKTCEEINDWVKEKTNGEITNIFGILPTKAAMILANALVFDAVWDDPYDKSDVQQHTFTTSNGTVQTGDFMDSEESVFLLDDNARGFAKAYKNRRYEFVALMPDLGVSLQEYISSLTGKRLLSIIDNPIRHAVDARLPKFDAGSKIDLKSAVKKMGIVAAFDEGAADFSGIGTPTDPDYNLCIGDILQQSKIRVNECGTKAIAVMHICLKYMYSCAKPQPYKVHLDRPFLYMIMDRETNLPLFMGTVENLS